MPDMRDSVGKVSEYCVESYRETLVFVNFSGIGPKFLAMQRRAF
ncbi:hypothetical protein ACVWXO_004707 [Bradyrhizobium sp. LM2.7]